MSLPTLIISTCGTSLLRNTLRDQPIEGFTLRDLGALTNAAAVEELPEASAMALDRLLRNAADRLKEGDLTAAAAASAEINGLHRLVGALHGGALHYLLATDTYLGRATAALLQTWLTDRGENAQIQPIKDLTTRSSAAFTAGIKELLSFAEQTIRPYAVQYRVVFNLTGGFKSWQGVMTTLGQFYADEIVYVFESERDLIRIPRLPITLDDELIEDNAAAFLQMAEGGRFLPLDALGGLPPALLEEAGEGQFGLSVWGELIWKRNRSDILRSRLVSLPMLRFESSFVKDFKRLQPTDKELLQANLAQVSRRLVEFNGSRTALLGGGYNYKNYSGSNAGYGHFYIDDNMRVSCQSGEGGLTLRHCGEHDYVNNKP